MAENLVRGVIVVEADITDAEEDRFFMRFIAFDCHDELRGIDADTNHWFCPSETERVIRRLWCFGGEIDGMDFASRASEDRRTGVSEWVVVGAEPHRLERDEWIRIVRAYEDGTCVLCLSYSIPREVVELFTDGNEARSPA